MNFLQAIRARRDAGSKPPGISDGSEATIYAYKAPKGAKVPYIVLKTPVAGTISDDTATRGHDDPVQVSAFAADDGDAMTLLLNFTDWAEEAGAWEACAPSLSVVLTPAAPRCFRNPSGTYQATCDLTARIQRDRPG